MRNYISDLDPCLQDGTCRRPTIWWADGQEEPTDIELTPPLDFLLEAWPKGWDEEILWIQSMVRTLIDHENNPLTIKGLDEKILCIQSKMREMMGTDKTPQDESNCV